MYLLQVSAKVGPNESRQRPPKDIDTIYQKFVFYLAC